TSFYVPSAEELRIEAQKEDQAHGTTESLQMMSAGGKGPRHRGEEGRMGSRAAMPKVAFKGDSPSPHSPPPASAAPVPAAAPEPEAQREVAADASPPERKMIADEARNAGILDVLKSADKPASSIFGRDSAIGNDAENALGNLIGGQIGES